jgi:formylglycine-generating enzyme
MIVRHNLPAMHILLAMLAGLFGFGGGAAAAQTQTFKDCPHCPQMVKVPAGTFMMGSSVTETMSEGVKEADVADERPQHSVTIKQEFALGKYPVTRGEFAAFVKETGYNAGPKCAVYAGDTFEERSGRSWRNPGYPQTDQHPVVCVSFEDAQHYVQWLSRKTGQSYRLPTEAEWEFAARAGTTNTRFWGDGREHACDFANVADFAAADALGWNKGDNIFHCRDGFAYTAPVGSFRPNAFGLYDMLGNVWQWTEDCHHDSYDGAPSDGSAWTSGECKYRVLRGSSWDNICIS